MKEIILVTIKMNPIYYLPFLVLSLLFLIFKHISSPSNLPPGPFPWPILGNILNMGNKPHISLAQLAAAHGPLMSLRLGTQILIVASSEAAASEILRTHDRILSARFVPHAVPASPDQMHLSMVWADCTDQWNYLRTLCRTELFSAKAIETQANIRSKKVAELVEFLATQEGRIVKIRQVVFVTVFNMLSNIFVSKDLSHLQEEIEDKGLKRYVSKVFEVLHTPNLADFYTILSGLDLQGLNKKTKQYFVQISGLWEVIIKERRDDKYRDVSRQGDFLDALLESGLSNDQISYLLLELLSAGTDTSTTTVEWAMAELIKHPEAMKKMHVELEGKTKGTAIKESDLPYLPYLHSIVKETLRLHPPAPLLLPRRALETCTLINYTIPKDSQVLINACEVGKDPNTWEDPMSFKPERFLDSSVDLNSSNFGFIPFGAGRRICPGVSMADKQLPLILASLIKCFDWSLPHDMHPTKLDMDEKFGLTLQMEKPLVVIPTVKKL